MHVANLEPVNGHQSCVAISLGSYPRSSARVEANKFRLETLHRHVLCERIVAVNAMNRDVRRLINLAEERIASTVDTMFFSFARITKCLSLALVTSSIARAGTHRAAGCLRVVQCSISFSSPHLRASLFLSLVPLPIMCWAMVPLDGCGRWRWRNGSEIGPSSP